MNKIFKIFDKLEDKIRHKFSRYPIIYALIGGIGTVLFWRGVWHTADYVSSYYLSLNGTTYSTINYASLADGLLSFFAGLILLLMTGLFVASFIGEHIIISGLKGEKKVSDKTAEELKEDVELTRRIYEEVKALSKRIAGMESKLEDRKDKV